MFVLLEGGARIVLPVACGMLGTRRACMSYQLPCMNEQESKRWIHKVSLCFLVFAYLNINGSYGMLSNHDLSCFLSMSTQLKHILSPSSNVN